MVNGNTRPSPFFVAPASSRTSPAFRSTCRHSSGRISLGVRQPVTKAKAAMPRICGGRWRWTLAELLRLKEPLPHVVLLEQRDVRPDHQLPRLHGERTHALENDQIAIDRRVRGALGEPVRGVGARVHDGDRHQPPVAEEGRQMLPQPEVDDAQRAALVDGVVVDEIRGGILEGDAVLVGRDRRAGVLRGARAAEAAFSRPPSCRCPS